MRYLLDTNICIHFLRGRYGVPAAVVRAGEQNCFISEITKAELLVGAEISESNGYVRNARMVRTFIGVIESVPVSGALEMYAREKARLRMDGQSVEDFDLLIGCTAVSSGFIMVSENVEHLSRISGIRVENWVERD